MSKIKTRIERGKKLENYVADQIVNKGLDYKAKRSIGSGSGNREKADIDTSLTVLGRNIGIEAKNHKVPHMKQWWEQACKLEKLGREPVLAYKLGGESLEATKVVIYLETFLDLLKLANSAETRGEIIVDDSQRMKSALYYLENAKDNLRKLKKKLSEYV